MQHVNSKLLLKLLASVGFAVLLTGCPIVRGAGETVDSVGEGAGHAVRATGEGVGHAVEGTGDAIRGATR